jgi:hypothetical protein
MLVAISPVHMYQKKEQLDIIGNAYAIHKKNLSHFLFGTSCVAWSKHCAKCRVTV